MAPLSDGSGPLSGRGAGVGFGRDAGELLVGRLLFLKRGLGQGDVCVVAQQLRPSAQRAVDGHFVVLYLLGGGDERGVEDGRIILGVLDAVFRLRDQGIGDLASF